MLCPATIRSDTTALSAHRGRHARCDQLRRALFSSWAFCARAEPHCEIIYRKS